MGAIIMYETACTVQEAEYRSSINSFFSSKRPEHILCWDLDGILERDGCLHPLARETLESFGDNWYHVLTTASGKDHADTLVQGINDLLESTFCNLGIRGRKSYAQAVQSIPEVKSVVVIGNEATDVPSDIFPDVFVYGTKLESIRSVIQWMETLGMGDLVLGYQALKRSRTPPVPAVFGEILGVRTVCVE